MKIEVNKGEIVIRCSPSELDVMQNHVYGLVDDGTLEPLCKCPWCRVMNVWDTELYQANQKNAEVNEPLPALEDHIYHQRKYGAGRK
jgi:hypothetical protein